MFSLAQAHNAFDDDGRIANAQLQERFERHRRRLHGPRRGRRSTTRASSAPGSSTSASTRTRRSTASSSGAGAGFAGDRRLASLGRPHGRIRRRLPGPRAGARRRGDRRRADRRDAGRAGLNIALAIGAAVAGAALYGWSLTQADHPAWPGWPVGALFALFSLYVVSDFVTGARDRAAGEASASALAIPALLGAIVLAGLSLLWGPIALLALAGARLPVLRPPGSRAAQARRPAEPAVGGA